MASVVAITSIELTKEQKKTLIAGVTRGIAAACGLDEEKVSFMLLPTLPKETTALRWLTG